MRLELPEGDFKAFLFDCDGTIVDSMPLHWEAWQSILDEYQCRFPQETFYSWGGMPTREIIRTLNEQQGLNMPVEETAKRKEALYFDIIHKLEAIPEVLHEIHEHYGRIPFAVVSGSTRTSVEKSLGALGILDKFDLLVCAGDYQRGKPAPDPFLLAAEKLGVKAEDCLVFEDTEMGIESATAAGMKSVKIMQPWERSAAV